MEGRKSGKQRNGEWSGVVEWSGVEWILRTPPSVELTIYMLIFLFNR